MNSVDKLGFSSAPRLEQPPHYSAISLDRPSTWKLFRKGDCTGCWSGCCTLPVEVSAFDLIRLGLTDDYEAGSSLKKLAKRLKALGVIRSFHPKTQIFTLEQRFGRDCLYLDPVSRLCTVYERRPEVCRRFPSIGPRPGYCPSLRK